MDASITRAEGGRFAPGSSGNPGGRRGLPADVRMQLEAALPKCPSGKFLNILNHL